ncbi:MAG: toll/interleukin-1 receptor domain-containing protein [Ruminococcaceae bacterium]|nr:toll/interleukin-1 receptor domain-containing protein [Oscillospiraceae bacterium]
MAVFKCKICGGNLEITEGMTACECEYCGTKQTVPNADNEKKINLFNRANRLRSACEFDKAASVYESIVAEFSEEAEAYWGLCLCKFGIEYVDDPKTAKKIPTCHRTSYISIFDDNDFDLACEYADSVALQLYRNEAKEIDRLQREILNIAKNEEPFDIFICYKESDENGARTIDSELAHDLYDVLTEKGYKVFYSRITLKSKLGQDYEPYIFSALNSAKLMLAVGTKYEYYNAVWVKNEWSRYIALMANNKEKMLIPCYKDIDAYDIPKEFNKLQGQDLNSPRAFQDLVANIERFFNPKTLKVQNKGVVVQQVSIGSPTENSLTDRIYAFLEDSDWDKAYEYCEKVLDLNVKNPHAYLCRLCAELRVRSPKELADLDKPFDNNANYQKFLRFADEISKSTIKEYVANISERIKEDVYNSALNVMQTASNEEEYKTAVEQFKSISGFRDADVLSKQCVEKAEECRKDAAYSSGKISMNVDKIVYYEQAIKIFESISGWKDANELIEICKMKIKEIEAIKKDKEKQAEINNRMKNLTTMFRKEQGLCQYCGGNFTGVFSKKCSVCGKEKDY